MSRVVFSTGEASGELNAVNLALAMREHEPSLEFAGIGAERMRANGFAVWHDTRGWASLGPLEAIARIPKLLAVMLETAARLLARPPALLVLVDFGAFNLRLARTLRALGYRAPILYFIPPAAWLDDAKRARMVAAATTPLVPFVHQRDFYRGLGLEAAYFGHPLASTTRARVRRAAPPTDGGTIAVLPGSRRGELDRHVPILLAAIDALRIRRPHARFVIGVANAESRERLQAMIADPAARAIAFVDGGAPAALADADAAWIASGTAVLEAALIEVPAVALYVLSAAQWKIALRVYRGRYITLPNLLLDREVVPELLQDAATPEALVDALDALLREPDRQLDAYAAFRAALGTTESLAQCAQFALACARGAQ